MMTVFGMVFERHGTEFPVVNRASLPRQALAGNPADPCNNVTPVNGRLKSTARPAARSWRKLHIGIDGESGEIVAIELTKKESDDAARTDALLDQLTDPLASFTADGAYDQDRV
jgi:Transposase DDE domain